MRRLNSHELFCYDDFPGPTLMVKRLLHITAFDALLASKIEKRKKLNVEFYSNCFPPLLELTRPLDLKWGLESSLPTPPLPPFPPLPLLLHPISRGFPVPS